MIGSPLKVLVIDDDPVVLEITSAMIRAMGHQVITKEGGLGTASVLLKEEPDVALVDIHMPGLSGDRIVELMSTREEKFGANKTSFILYSGAEKPELESLAKKTGVLGFIQKTPDLHKLREKFQQLLLRRERLLSSSASSG